MMLPTHALGGMLLALAVTAVAPEFAPVALVAGLLGGVFPDLDLYAGHRKSLHYPVYYSAAVGPSVAVAALFPAAPTVFAACFVAGAAAHSVADALGGGLELRPWEATSDRAVYDHFNDRWVAPRRWVRYDGSPGDLSLSVALAVPLVATLDGGFERLVLATVAIGVVYAAVRRFLPTLAELLVDGVLAPRVPDHLLARVPARYRRQQRAYPAGSPAAERGAPDR